VSTRGWLVFRIDDTEGALEAQLLRVLVAVRSIDPSCARRRI
jgi:hypothetical protein